jgi:L-cysteine desulfidase
MDLNLFELYNFINKIKFEKCKVIVAQVRMDTAMPGRGSGLMA